MNRWHAVRKLLLVWLGSALLSATYATYAVRHGTPNWLDVLVFSTWVIIAGTHLKPLSHKLRHHRLAVGLSLILLIVTLLILALPWALYTPVHEGLWRMDDTGRYFLDLHALTPRRLWLTVPQTWYLLAYILRASIEAYQRGTTPLLTPFRAIELALGTGLGLTLLAWAWAFVSVYAETSPAIQRVLSSLRSWLESAWRLLRKPLARLRRTRAWRLAAQTFRWTLVTLLALDGIGLLLTARSVKVEWEPILTSGFPAGPPLSVSALAMDPAGRLYAGTYIGGIFRSDDGGEHWHPVNEGLTSLSITSLVVGPEGELYAGTYIGGIFRSDDGGEHWQAVNQGLTNLDVQTLLVGPEGELYAGTDGGGIFRSDDGGEHWHPVNEGLTNQSVNSLAAGPEGEIYAGTGRLFESDGGVFRSDDGGEHWRPVNQGLTYRSVTSLLIGPEGGLYAGTGSWGHGGVFRSDDGGEHWQPVNEGLTDLNVLTLLAGPEGELYAGTDGGGVFRSDDGGEHWQPTQEGLPSTTHFGAIQMYAHQGKLDLSRPGMTHALPWAIYREQAPQALYIHGHHATLYAFAGAAMLLRAEVPLPLIWRAPTPYLAMVATTWHALAWIDRNALPLSIALGLVLLVLSFYTASVALPNRLRPRTVLRLLPRPRHLLAASGYRDYARRWAEGNALERLLLLALPQEVEAPFTLEEAKAVLQRMNAAVSTASLRSGLEALRQRGLLLQEDGSWRLAQPLTAQVQRWEQGRDALPRLAEETRREHPLHAATHRFFAQAGMALSPVPGTPFYRATPPEGLGRLLPPKVYLRVLPDDILNSREVRAMRASLQEVDAEAHHLFVVTDRRPSDDGWAQIGTLRMEGFYLLPLDEALIYKGLTARARTILRDEVEERLGGRYDPYDVRDPVSGAFGFFGREGWVQGLLRRIEAGRPVGLFGLRKMGKSSLLRVLGERATFPVAVVNLQTMETVPQLYRRILRYWSEWLRARGGLLWEPPELPATDPTGAFTEAVLSLLERLETMGYIPRLTVLLDEIEQVVPHPDGSGPDLTAYLTFFRALRGLVDEDGRLSLVVAGLNPAINRINAWGAEQNPTFSLFQEEVVGPLAPQAATQMMRNLGRQVGLVYAEASLREILTLSGGHPFLARQLGSLLLRMRDYNPGEVQLDEVRQAAERFIYDGETAYHLEQNLWRDAGNPTLWGEKQARINHLLLLELARAEQPLSKAHLLDGPQADLRREALLRLERFHLIHQPEPGIYALRYGLLRAWLRRRRLGLE